MVDDLLLTMTQYAVTDRSTVCYLTSLCVARPQVGTAGVLALEPAVAGHRVHILDAARQAHGLDNTPRRRPDPVLLQPLLWYASSCACTAPDDLLGGMQLT